MLKIWGRNNSVNVQKVLWCCEELGLKYERLDAGGSFGVVNTPQYRALNPNGLVPTIEDGPFVLWESNAIVRYLTAKHSSGKLWPEDHKVRAEADKWMDWQNSMFWPVFRPLFWNVVRTPADERDAERDGGIAPQDRGDPRLSGHAPQEPPVYRRRRPDDGRHPDGLRRLALDVVAGRAARPGQSAALVRYAARAAGLPAYRDAAGNLKWRSSHNEGLSHAGPFVFLGEAPCARLTPAPQQKVVRAHPFTDNLPPTG